VSNDLGSAILAALAVSAMATIGYACRRDWLAPSAFGPLLWVFYLSLPLIAARDYSVSGNAVWKIAFLLSSLQLGALAGEGIGRQIVINGGKGTPRPAFSEALALRLLWMSGVCALVAMIGTLYLAFSSLSVYGLQTSIAGLLGLGPHLAAERYVAGRSYSTVTRALLLWPYPAALLGGLSYPCLRSRRHQLVAAAAFIPALLLSIVTAIRATTLFAVACWATAYIAVTVCSSRGSYRIWRAGFVLKAAVGLGIAILFALTIQVLRAGIEQAGDLASTWEHLRPGFLGYLAAFSEWDRSGPEKLSWGFYTFAGVFDMIGVRSRDIGVYATSVNLSGVDTNIYTVFRGLIEDFGFAGALVSLSIVGFIAGWAYRQVRAGQSWYCLILAGYYACCIWSPIASFFVYNGLVLAWLVGAVALWWPLWDMDRRMTRSMRVAQTLGAKVNRQVI